MLKTVTLHTYRNVSVGLQEAVVSFTSADFVVIIDYLLEEASEKKFWDIVMSVCKESKNVLFFPLIGILWYVKSSQDLM